MIVKVAISDIIIGKRIREDAGDLSELMESMNRIGLINPVTISENNELIAGFRRLKSAMTLGWKEIECTVVKVESPIHRLEIEAQENLARKDFSPEELVKLHEEEEYARSTGFARFKLWLKRLKARFLAWIREKKKK